MGLEIGLITGALYILASNYFSANSKRRRKQAEYSRPVGKRLVPVATIAKNLLPLFKPHVSDGDKLLMVGDGFYAVSESKKYWDTCLTSWFNSKVSFHYVLIDPVPGAVEAINATRERCGCDGDLVNITIIRSSDQTGDAQKICNLFQTLHPTLLLKTDGRKAMWLEKNHPKKSVVSYDNVFIEPTETEGENLSEIEKYRSYIDTLLESNITLPLSQLCASRSSGAFAA